MNAVFEKGVRTMGWRRLRRGDRLELPSDGNVIVVGVAIWNADDREVLNIVAKQMPDSGRVVVFDLDDVRSVEELHAFMPSAAMPLHTPVAAEYRRGRLVRDASGSDVRILIAMAANDPA
jgi:hypothetical protein